MGSNVHEKTISIRQKVLNCKVKTTMDRLHRTNEQVYFWVRQYTQQIYPRQEDYPPDLVEFFNELVKINGGEFSIRTPTAVSVDKAKGYINDLVPDMLKLLQRSNPEAVERIDALQWRDMFCIGIQISGPDSPEENSSSR